MERLEKIVEEMESSKLPLEDLLVRYEEGIKLVGVCNERLAGAESRIETLSRTRKRKTTDIRCREPSGSTQGLKQNQE